MHLTSKDSNTNEEWQRNSHPGFQLLHLLLATFHGYLFSFVQPVLKVLNGLFHVFLHALEVSAGVLFLFQLLCHHGGISYSFLSLLLCIATLLHRLLHLVLKLGRVSLELLFLV